MKHTYIAIALLLILVQGVCADEPDKQTADAGSEPVLKCLEGADGAVKCWLAGRDRQNSQCKGDCPEETSKKLENLFHPVKQEVVLCKANGKCEKVQLFIFSKEAFEELKLSGKTGNCQIKGDGKSECQLQEKRSCGKGIGSGKCDSQIEKSGDSSGKEHRASDGNAEQKSVVSGIE